MFVITSTSPVYCTVIYRPLKPNSNFLPEFSDFMADVIVRYDKVIMAGDFNFHMDDATNIPAAEFIRVTESFNLLHQKGPQKM